MSSIVGKGNASKSGTAARRLSLGAENGTFPRRGSMNSLASASSRFGGSDGSLNEASTALLPAPRSPLRATSSAVECAVQELDGDVTALIASLVTGLKRLAFTAHGAEVVVNLEYRPISQKRNHEMMRYKQGREPSSASHSEDSYQSAVCAGCEMWRGQHYALYIRACLA